MESVCFKITSAADYDRCYVDTAYTENRFMGSPIDILQNGILISNIPGHFTQFHECFDRQEDDIFEFKPQNGDGVRFCYLNINSTKIVNLGLYNKFFYE